MSRAVPVALALAASACATTSTQLSAELGPLLAPAGVTRAVLPPDAPRAPGLGEVLTLERAVELALSNHPESRAVLEELGVARGQWGQAGLLPNPEVEFELRDPGGAQSAQLDLGLELNLTAMVLAPARASVAAASLEAARLRTAGRLLELAFRARLAFLEAQAAQQRFELRERLLESQQASYATALELSRVGNLVPLALADELSQVELARVQVAEAENALLDARERLNQALGLFGPATQWRLEAPLAMPEATVVSDEAEAKVVAASLELRELEQRIEAARRQVRLTTVEGWLPHVSGGFHGERDGELWELGAHVAVSLPVFDRAQGRAYSAERELRALEHRREGLAIALRSSVRVTLNRVESAGRRADHYLRRLLPARERQLEQTVLQYNAMQLGVFEVLRAQRAVTEVAIAQVDAALDYWKARTTYELLRSGRASPASLEAVATSTSLSTSAAPAAH